MNSENKLVIEQLNKFGRVPQTHELLQMIEQLQQENKKQKERIEYLERSNNRREDTILEQRQEISDLEDNWETIKQYCLDEQIPEEYDEYNSYIEFSNSVYDNILNKMQKIEGSDSK